MDNLQKVLLAYQSYFKLKNFIWYTNQEYGISQKLLIEDSTYYLLLAVVSGAVLGNFTALKFLPKNGIRIIAVAILIYAGIRLLLRSL